MEFFFKTNIIRGLITVKGQNGLERNYNSPQPRLTRNSLRYTDPRCLLTEVLRTYSM